MRISDWSSDVCSSDLEGEPGYPLQHMVDVLLPQVYAAANAGYIDTERLAISGQSYGGYSTASIVSQTNLFRAGIPVNGTYDLAGFYGGLDEQGNSHWRSEEHTSELQSLMRISYAVF